MSNCVDSRGASARYFKVSTVEILVDNSVDDDISQNTQDLGAYRCYAASSGLTSAWCCILFYSWRRLRSGDPGQPE